MSTTNILNSTVTGVPFLEIGRISVMERKRKINYQRNIYKQTVFFLFIYLYVMQWVWCYAKVKIKANLISVNLIHL